ncbi:hypothetical protein [Paracoccus sp. MC1862]|uniref:hypothetical protein n=1 Tax=Paracoccus sp. MC1862 TaxID=2760307 RepID=UPI001600DD6F|nr:hypothetical protein [Paracoccus sp. MC1862]MBB1496805.1 hypothetical protein [Paracoccus sp. MC1862]
MIGTDSGRVRPGSCQIILRSRNLQQLARLQVRNDRFGKLAVDSFRCRLIRFGEQRPLVAESGAPCGQCRGKAAKWRAIGIRPHKPSAVRPLEDAARRVDILFRREIRGRDLGRLPHRQGQ